MNTKSTKPVLVMIAAFAIAGAWSFAHAADSKQPAKEAKKEGQTVQMKVTEKGFEPENVTVKKDEPVTLVITRTTEKTCANEIVIDDYGINTKLPLNKAVSVTFTPKKAGAIKYGCAMGKMIGGVLKVQ
jgi:plastocyanin domain-containing protein